MVRVVLSVICVALWTASLAAYSRVEGRSLAVPCPRNVNPAFPTHSVTLPDGRVLCSSATTPVVEGKHARIELTAVAVRLDYVPHAQFVVGNHAEVLSEEKVLTAAGEATLAFVRRTPPAASSDKTPTYEYWLFVWRTYPQRKDMALAEAIRAVIVGQPAKARQEVLDLATTWQVEGEPIVHTP